MVHDYFGISLDIVWDVVVNHVPPLREKLEPGPFRGWGEGSSVVKLSGEGRPRRALQSRAWDPMTCRTGSGCWLPSGTCNHSCPGPSS